jgi:oxygen-independent coproporphyrinogen-3 oxidase
MCWFCGCNKIITRNQENADRYLDYLAKELQLWQPHIRHIKIDQIHFGGGTPNFLTVPQIDRLNALIKCYLPVLTKVQVSVELSPDQLDEGQVKAFARLGATRASIGVQDTSPVVQKAVNRIQPQSCNVNAMQWLRDEGFDSINLDLIYGLPYQTEASFAQTIEQVLELKPDRIALFNYAHVPWFKPSQKIFASDVFPNPMLKLAIFQSSCLRLQEAGYTYIGLDHFAKQDDELAKAWRNGEVKRDFQGYSARQATTILGLGMSSVSQSENAYRQNYKDLKDYQSALDAGRLPLAKGITLTWDDRIRRHIINHLMCNLELEFKVLDLELGIDTEAYLAKDFAGLQTLIEDGIVLSHSGGIKVTDTGRLFLRNVAMQFDAYREQQEGRCSQTV